MPNPSINIRRFVAETAIAHADQIKRSDQPALFEFVATLLDGPEAEQARLVAFAIDQSERAQLQLTALLREAR